MRKACSALVKDKKDEIGRIPHCKNGFMITSPICNGRDHNEPPQCMDEKECAHFYPKTGTPFLEFKNKFDQRLVTHNVAHNATTENEIRE